MLKNLHGSQFKMNTDLIIICHTKTHFFVFVHINRNKSGVNRLDIKF